jgi:hypothetical protein
MTGYRDSRRWFLRHGGEEQPFVEVDKVTWMQAEWNAGFRGDSHREPATDGFGGTIDGTIVHGIIVYGNEPVPAGAMELIPEGPTVTYEWMTRIFASEGYGQEDMPSFANHQKDAEERARWRAANINRRTGTRSAVAMRRRIETYGWEEVPGE